MSLDQSLKCGESDIFRIALAQINSTVGDLCGNLEKIAASIQEAKQQEVDLLAFPEMVITGYPPEDLLLKPVFVADNLKALQEVVSWTEGLTLVVGFVDRAGKRDESGAPVLYNAAAVIHDRKIITVYHKVCLPNYGVFDEKRYFEAGAIFPVLKIAGLKVGINICEDIWQEEGPSKAQVLEGGAQFIVNINASPYQVGKVEMREQVVSARAATLGVPVAYVNMVGGQDELVFDGGSLIMDAEGQLVARAAQFETEMLVADIGFETWTSAPEASKLTESLVQSGIQKFTVSEAAAEKKGELEPSVIVSRLDTDEEIYQALVLGLSDYMSKNRFKKGVVAISGGIDSALTAAIAVDALGAENIVGVFMPSQYTSAESVEDASRLAKNLGIRLEVYPITDLFSAYRGLLSETFRGRKEDLTEENLQSRIRGNIMMALSNKLGWLVLTTGNKSEMSVGYATLYGDMAGGFAVIKDVWKKRVYRLANMKNEMGMEIIPQRTIERPPTAELRPDQCDQDSLPDYDCLDAILQAYVEQHQTKGEIVDLGFEPEVVTKVIRLVDASEFKRRQAPVGIKISSRALGKDRRMPITNRYVLRK